MWEYSESGRLVTMSSVGSSMCIFCKTDLLRLPAQQLQDGQRLLIYQVSICANCGWWTVYRVHQGEHPRSAGVAEGYSAAIGCLKELDLTDISLPMREVRQYLAARSEKVFDLAPRLLENLVSSVFRDFGWLAQTTAYSGDGGIDVILKGEDNHTIGVQVKRNKEERRIEAEQIRSLAGALLLEGHTQGVFITTSGYRKGASLAAERFRSIGLPILLVNGCEFLEALGIAQIQTFDPDDERYHACVDLPGVHIGTGSLKSLEEGEILCNREIVITLKSREDFMELSDEQWTSIASGPRPWDIPEAKFVVKKPEVWWRTARLKSKLKKGGSCGQNTR